MSELYHECGVAAIYYLPGHGTSDLCESGPDQSTRLLVRMLLDIQNRGQLSAGITTFNPTRDQLIDTHKDIGSVSEVFQLSHPNRSRQLMEKYAGLAGIGHVRYATCGASDRSYAQPFERHHIQKNKWFSFAFNGQLANYQSLRAQLLSDDDHHLARETDTEIIMHELSKEWSGDRKPSLLDVIKAVSQRFDGAYTLALINARGDMLLARDPLGIKPLCYARRGPLFAAASESVALQNLGFDPEEVIALEPGEAITIVDGDLKVERYASNGSRAHCFFEWIYFANVASTLDNRSVYLTREALGTELARIEKERGLPIDDNTIVVPVPDTSKAAASAMAYELGIPMMEGLIRNRYAGRTFIEEGAARKAKAQTKYTPLREVLEGKRVFLVEDSIVRSTTMKVLLNRLRQQGGAKELHVRVACPPIIAPCFYGIDMSTVNELFAPKFLQGEALNDDVQELMAAKLGADSLRYLPIPSIARAIGYEQNDLCQACITGNYPTDGGQKLYSIALDHLDEDESGRRTYDTNLAASPPT